jgi:hypothetical protein
MKFSKFIQWINRYSEKISLFHVIILSIFFMLISAYYHQGGILHPEMDIRLPFYLSDTPLINKFFDSEILEKPFFRARELSYVFDFIDSKFIEFGIENGFPHFLSLTHYLFAIATGCLLWMFCVKELNLKPLMGIGWLVLFWTSPGIFFGGTFFRAAKIGVAFLGAVLFYVIYKAAVITGEKPDSQISKKFWFGYSAAIFLITFFDEQGLYFAFTALLFLSVWDLFFRNRNINIMLLIGVAGIILYGLYRYVVAPQLIFILNGYYPDVSYIPTIPIGNYVQNLTHHLSNGFFLYIETFRFLIGDPPRIVAIGFLFVFIIFVVFHLFSRSAVSDHDRNLFILALVELLLINFLIIVMNSLMSIKNPRLMWPDVTRMYYFLPATAILAMMLAVLTNMFCKLRISSWLIFMVLCLAIVGNIAALPKHNEIMRQGHMQKYYQPSFALLEALKNPGAIHNDEFLSDNFTTYTFFKSRNKKLPTDSNDYNGKGLYFAERCQYRQAIKNFDQAIILNRNDVHAYINRGNIYLKISNYRQAIEDFNTALRLKPDSAAAFYSRGLAYFRQDRDDLGCFDARKACILGNCKLVKQAIAEGYCP